MNLMSGRFVLGLLVVTAIPCFSSAQEILSGEIGAPPPILQVYGSVGKADINLLEVRASHWSQSIFGGGGFEFVPMGTRAVEPGPYGWQVNYLPQAYPFFVSSWGCPNTGYQIGFVGFYRFELLLDGVVVDTEDHFYWHDCVFGG